MEVTVTHPEALAAPDLDRWTRWHGRDALTGSPFVHPTLVRAAGEVMPGTRVAVIRWRGEVAGYFPFEVAGRDARSVAGPANDGDGIVLRPGIGLDGLALVRACGLRSFSYQHLPAGPSPFAAFSHHTADAARVSLVGGWGAYAERVRTGGSKVLADARRKERKLAREVGPVRFDLQADHDAHADALVAMKISQLDHAGDTGVPLRGTAVPQLIRALGRTAPEDGFGSYLSTLHAGDRLLAAAWSVRSGRHLVLSIPAHDPEVAALSPGLVLHARLLEAVADEVDEVDLGLAINQTKRRLMTHAVPYAQGTVYAAAPLRAYRRARTAARRLVRGR